MAHDGLRFAEFRERTNPSHIWKSYMAGWRRRAPLFLILLVIASPAPALAASAMEDTIADYIALLVMIFAPVVLIVVFLIIHVLPEKVAFKRKHPQAEAIRALCYVSLVFGGLLWPLAWIWAYGRPVLHKLAYGVDEVEHEHGKAEVVAEIETVQVVVREDVVRLRQHIAAMDNDVPSAEAMRRIRAELAALEARFARADKHIEGSV